MRSISKISSIGAMVAFISLGLMFPAHAYLDPGTGSMLLQSMFVAFAAGVGFLTHFRYKVTSWWNRMRGHEAGSSSKK